MPSNYAKLADVGDNSQDQAGRPGLGGGDAGASRGEEPRQPQHATGASTIRVLDTPPPEDEDDKQSDLSVMFTMKGSVIPRISGMCAACSLIGIVGLYAIEETGVTFNDYLHKVVVMPLGFLLVFRSNLAYGRFWESRGHIGAILRNCRLIACKVGAKCCVGDAADSLVAPAVVAMGPSLGDSQSGRRGAAQAPQRPIPPPRGCLSWSDATDANASPRLAAGGADAQAEVHTPPELTRFDLAVEMQRLLVLLYYVVVHTLRDLPLNRSDNIMLLLTDGEVEELSVASFKPVIVVRWCLQHVQLLADRGVFTWWEHQGIVGHLDHLTECAVGAHKVASTPIPFPYTQMLSWLVYVFILSVPLTIATAYTETPEDRRTAANSRVALSLCALRIARLLPQTALSPSTVCMVAFSSAVIAFALLGINETASELEAPFGFDANDIALGKLGESMELDATVLLRGTSAGKEFKRAQQAFASTGKATPTHPEENS